MTATRFLRRLLDRETKQARVCESCGYTINTERLACPACGSPMPPVRGRQVRHSRHPEDDHQVAIFQWAALKERQIPELRMLFHVPNGGSRNPREGGRLKAQGVRAGVPDIFLDVPRGAFHGLRIELKATAQDLGRTPHISPDQRWWIKNMGAQGYRAVVCQGSEAAIREITNYLSLIKPQGA